MKYCIGPMTKNITDAVIDYCLKNDVNIGLIPSRRQVEFNGGYVNNWNTYDFSKYVKSKNKNMTIIRDHGGPDQGATKDDGEISMAIDCVCLDGIHVDIWKKYSSLEDSIEQTVKYIQMCLKINENIFFEIGTEQAIRKYEAEELDQFLSGVKAKLGSSFEKIRYAVIQSGTSLKNTENTGVYDKDRLKAMLKVCKKYNLLSKEHNGDYISQIYKNEKFGLGLDCINIAPEFGVIETECIMSAMDEVSFNTFFEMCLASKKWEKWVSPDFKPYDNKIETVKICGHYIRSSKFIEKFVENSNMNDLILEKITKKLDELHNKIGT